MGYAQRQGDARRAMLNGLVVAVDVQHLYRSDRPRDRGSVYTLANGTHTDEATATLGYSSALVAWLLARGAQVLRNGDGIPPGTYRERNEAAGSDARRAHAYIACHLNAGGGHYAAVEFMDHPHARPTAHDSAVLAKAVTLSLQSALGIPGHTVRLADTERGAVCIRAFPRAAVLVEPFFGDTPQHQHLLSAPELVRVGEAIGAGVAEWWRVANEAP